MGYTKDDYRNAGFDTNQVMYIDYALHNGISADVLELFIDITKPRKFNAAQIEQIVVGLMRNLPIDQIKAYAKSKYNAKAMSYSIAAFEKNPSQKVFELINSGTYRSEQLIQIINLILTGRDFDIMLRHDLNGNQLKMIKQGIDLGLTDDQIAVYADPRFSADQMRLILLGFYNRLDVSWYADTAFDFKQMHIILKGLKSGIDVSWFADPIFSTDQMEHISSLLGAGMPEADIAKLAFPKISASALWDIDVLFTVGNVNVVDIYKKYRFNNEEAKKSPEFKVVLLNLPPTLKEIFTL